MLGLGGDGGREQNQQPSGSQGEEQQGGQLVGTARAKGVLLGARAGCGGQGQPRRGQTRGPCQSGTKTGGVGELGE